MSQLNLYSYDSKDYYFNIFDENSKSPSLEMDIYNNIILDESPKISYQKLLQFKEEEIENNGIKSKKENEHFTDKKRIYKVIYPNKFSLFTDAINKETIFNNDKYNFKKRAKSKIKMERYKCNDNMRKMIKRRFINTYLKKALNERLAKEGFNSFLEYLPQCFVGNVIKKKEKILLNKTLLDIFEKK